MKGWINYGKEKEKLSKVVGGSSTVAGYLGQGIFQFIFGKGKHR